jgi:acyl dehydratase
MKAAYVDSSSRALIYRHLVVPAISVVPELELDQLTPAAEQQETFANLSGNKNEIHGDGGHGSPEGNH